MIGNRHWTEPELATLRRLWPDSSTRELAAKLGRSVQAIKDAGSRLGLRKSDEYIAAMFARTLPGFVAAGQPHRLRKGRPPWNNRLPRKLHAVQRLVCRLNREIRKRA